MACFASPWPYPCYLECVHLGGTIRGRRRRLQYKVVMVVVVLVVRPPATASWWSPSENQSAPFFIPVSPKARSHHVCPMHLLLEFEPPSQVLRFYFFSSSSFVHQFCFVCVSVSAHSAGWSNKRKAKWYTHAFSTSTRGI